MRPKLKQLLEEYGRIAIFTYFGIFLLTLAGFAVAISYGLKVKSAQGGAGLLVASWLATKLTQPLRIAATLALSPLIATALRKLRRPESSRSAPPEATSSEASSSLPPPPVV